MKSIGRFLLLASAILITLLSVQPLRAQNTAALFAHVAVGGGFSTTFTLLNTGTELISGNLILTRSDGSPMIASLTASGNSPISASSIPVQIQPGGTEFITASAANPNDSLAGWARVESSGGNLGGVATFALTASGQLQTIAGVLSGDQVQMATIPVDNDEGTGHFTGYAIANPGTGSINIKIVVVDSDGNPVESISPPSLNPLAPGQQVPRFLHQDLPNRTSFKGSMVLIAQPAALFSVVALVQVQGATGVLYTAIPIIPAKAPNIN